MDKSLIGICAFILGILGGFWLLVGLVVFVVLFDSVKMIGAVFVLIGAVFLAMTFMLMKMIKRTERELSHIVTYGKKIQAQIVEVKCISSVEINRRHPYVLVCGAQSRTFESEYFYHDVHRFDGRDTIDVYLDESTDEYVVDLDS